MDAREALQELWDYSLRPGMKKELSAGCVAAAIAALERETDEKLLLAMSAGARAIERNKRLIGITYVYDLFGDSPKELSYFEAAGVLRKYVKDKLEG